MLRTQTKEDKGHTLKIGHDLEGLKVLIQHPCLSFSHHMNGPQTELLDLNKLPNVQK